MKEPLLSRWEYLILACLHCRGQDDMQIRGSLVCVFEQQLLHLPDSGFVKTSRIGTRGAMPLFWLGMYSNRTSAPGEPCVQKTKTGLGSSLTKDCTHTVPPGRVWEEKGCAQAEGQRISHKIHFQDWEMPLPAQPRGAGTGWAQPSLPCYSLNETRWIPALLPNPEGPQPPHQPWSHELTSFAFLILCSNNYWKHGQFWPPAKIHQNYRLQICHYSPYSQVVMIVMCIYGLCRPATMTKITTKHNKHRFLWIMPENLTECGKEKGINQENWERKYKAKPRQTQVENTGLFFLAPG